MTIPVVFALLVAVSCSHAFSVPAELPFRHSDTWNVEGYMEPKELKLIASVNGKHYFLDTTQSRSWSSGRDFCRAANMNLAKITTAEEAAAVKAAFNNLPSVRTTVWIDGTEKLLLSSFRWDSNGASLPSVLPFALYPDKNYDPHWCLVYHHEKNRQELHWFVPDTCSSKYWVMCEAN